jgi:NTE family protein
MRTVSRPVSTQPAVSGRPPLAARTAFVLAGGGSLGAMQVGMLRGLYERGVAPDPLVGTSAGALNAAFIASRLHRVVTAEALAHVWRGLHREDIFPINPRMVIGGLANQRDHLLPNRGLRRFAARHLQIERLDDASVPLHLVAFDLLSGREVRVSDGPALDAVLAAAAIPGVLPVRLGDRLLVDGGVVSKTPISHAVEFGAERIYVLATEDPAARAVPLTPRGALDAAVHAFTLLVGTHLQADLARYATAAELIVLPAVDRERIQPTDSDHASRLMAHALASAGTALAPQVVELVAA